MATKTEVHQARVRLAYLLRSMFRRIDKRKIGADRHRNLPSEMSDYLRAGTIAARNTMQFVTALARRFDIELNANTIEVADDELRDLRVIAAFIPEALAGDLAGRTHDDKRIVPWAVIAQHTNLEAVRIVVNEGADFFVTFAQTPESPQDVAYFPAHVEHDGPRWTGVLPGEAMQSPKQHRAWFQVVSPLAHGHDEKAGNVCLFRRQPQVDPFTGEQALVPIYTGNAIKGQWRDLFFARMLRALGVKPETDLSQRRAQELFSGGTIEKGADGAVARLDVRTRARSTIPAIDLLGGCIEQQIMSGILRVHDCTLLCRENAWKLFRMMAPADILGCPLEYEDFAASLLPADDWTLLRLGVRHAHRDLPGGDLSADEGGAQMLWNTEAIKPGARFFHTFAVVSLSTVSSLAQSCLADLLEDFADIGMLGAQTSRGYGQVSTLGYKPAEKATPLPSGAEYLDYLRTHREPILEWLAGTTEPAPKKTRGRKEAVA